MPGSGVPLGGVAIRSHLQEVADQLDGPGPQHTLVLVGGALLAWHGLRDTTRDVDSLRRLDTELRRAVERVAKLHGLTADWLNDNAAGFRPVTFDEQDCDVLLDHPRLLVLGAPLDQVFLMKLYRVEAQDYEDLIRMWPQCSFASPADAAAQFQLAYPHAPDDPGLVAMIVDIESAAGSRG
jgi:hypothetical protein